jgi:hypothetical protein
MPTAFTRRLAGIQFVNQPPQLQEKLPRMDIAAFVGFASAGPLHQPVVVEDAAQFTAIFGDDLPLAWDAQKGEQTFACLAPAMRAFFRNGGRRCWVIRVADEPETDFFPLPGMLERTSNGELRPAFARARSPGSWFDHFQCATALAVAPIVVTRADSPEKLIVQLRTGTEVQPDDLLRLRFLGRRIHLFVHVSDITAHVESPPRSRSHLFEIQGKLLGAFEDATAVEFGGMEFTATWVRLPKYGDAPADAVLAKGSFANSLSPPDTAVAEMLELRIPESSSPPTEPFLPLPGTILQIEIKDSGGMLWFRVASLGRDETGRGAAPGEEIHILGHAFRRCGESPPISLPQVSQFVAEKLTFELRVRLGNDDAVSLTDLGFAWANPRCGNALPDDQSLFERDDLKIGPTLAADELHDDLRREAAEHPSNGARFPLASTDDENAVFLPLFVQALPDEFLPAAHTDADELTRDGLANFHSSLFLDEELIETTANSLLAEADFIRYQRPNWRRLRGIYAALEIEEATLIAVPDAVHVGWKPVLIEDVPRPDKSDWLAHPCWGLSDECDDASKLVRGERPRYDKFLNCALREIQEPFLFLQQAADALGTFTLAWTSAKSGLTFILEEATRPDWSDSREIYRGEKAQRTLYGHRTGTYYYRVRAEAGCDTSNWSNEIVVTVPRRARYDLLQVEERSVEEHAPRPPDNFDPALLFDLHRSLLRLCAARGDLFAVLAVPEHFRAEDSLNHVRLLKASERDETIVIGRTLPFTRGENHVFSFGAVYHPWLITRETDGKLLHSPPDGAALGIIARRSLERGAWLAPANEEFRGVIALNPPLADGRRLDLLLAQLNQITQEPEGFLALNADTLSVEPELRPINVRRLLILLRRAALKRGAQYVFEPNGGTLRRLVQSGFEALLDQLFVRGAFAGATRPTSYEVVTDDSINTPQTRDLGQFRVDLKVAPSLPMSFVTVRLVQTGDRGVATELI